MYKEKPHIPVGLRDESTKRRPPGRVLHPGRFSQQSNRSHCAPTSLSGGQVRAPSVPYLSIPCIGGCGGILQTFFVHSIESLKWRPEPLKRQPEPVPGKFPK
ncbi:uncharacterized protein METZ01_LOCUS440199 [marine metagenome]|uniref:Uncharacterized protein n=1 Tax=marine metagenome TaxID=408172 RepID=A0A382YWZ8_9ZZZZ